MTNYLRVLEPGFPSSVESALNRFFSPGQFDFGGQSLQMRVDISEKDDSYQIKADLPGVKKEDINVRIDGNVVQIDAEIKQEKETKGDNGKVIRSERYYGTVSRNFSLSQDVDDDKAQAKYADGVLTLDLPKKTTPTSKKVTVE